jgi:pectinesterase
MRMSGGPVLARAWYSTQRMPWILLLAANCAHASGRGSTWDAVVDQRGPAAYQTLKAALDQAPLNSTRPYRIFIRNGRYYEKLTVTKRNIHLYGEDRANTIVTYDAASDTPNPEGGTYGTRGSFTIKILAPDFRAENITFENGFDYMANLAKPDTDPTKFRNPQGVAVMLDEQSDRAVFRSCTIKGNQDTLFPNAGRSYFEDCTISGNVDFIFGAGTALFNECDIVSVDRKRTKDNGYITAASTNINQPFGFVFLNCRLLKDSPQMAAGSVHLGRPWHPFADSSAVGHVVFIDTWMDDHISDAGWVRMSSLNAAGDRIWFEPADARLFELGSRGPGARITAGRRLLPASERERYALRNVLGGWDPLARSPQRRREAEVR